MWAHAEYVKLLRSFRDGIVFDRIPEVTERYTNGVTPRLGEVWKSNRRAAAVEAGTVLRVQASRPFRLRWTNDEWLTPRDADSLRTAPDIEYVDLELALNQRAPIRFTFYWTADDRWEGKDYAVDVFPPTRN
jgi:glucoamylase